jgi:hypothetical protein
MTMQEQFPGLGVQTLEANMLDQVIGGHGASIDPNGAIDDEGSQMDPDGKPKAGGGN